MAMAMRYLMIRINCLMHGHDWRETSGSSGVYDRCHRCYTEKASRDAAPRAVQS
jgi:hypothetical protein